MKVSEINSMTLAEYLRLDSLELSRTEKMELTALLKAAKAYVKSYTGLTESAIDEHEDFVVVVYILVQDMYDNRVLYVERNNLNKVVETILGMHSINLL